MWSCFFIDHDHLMHYGQDLSENLSTFSAHITNVLEVLKEANKESFVIMDELGSGTDLAEGMRITIAILKELI